MPMRLLELQSKAPPFAGFLACDLAELSHIFVSPGPIFEPLPAADATGHGMDIMFAAAGVGSGDVALNTWSYHLVPAGLLFDQGLRAVGATVVPAGTGNTELQAELLLNLRPTVFLGSTAHFANLVEILEAKQPDVAARWNLEHAFLGGEFGDWSAKRRAIEARFAIRTWSCYGTADLGMVGYEKPDDQGDRMKGYLINQDRYVEICDPVLGTPLPQGSSGEIVVTTLSRGWPMIRFGTGDVARALELGPDGGAEHISASKAALALPSRQGRYSSTRAICNRWPTVSTDCARPGHRSGGATAARKSRSNCSPMIRRNRVCLRSRLRWLSVF